MKSFDTRRFAVIADIHSNADALIAVLEDIRPRMSKVSSILVTI